MVHRETERGAYDQRHLHIQPVLTIDSIAHQPEPESAPVRRPEMAQDVLR